MKVSIITVVLNDDVGLKRTIESVLAQTYDDIEFLVIDGGSSDGTLRVIEEHKADINFWISEEDKGIYYAMNKGIKKSTGEWINFMNAGDTFYDKETLKSLFELNKAAEFDVFYGDRHVRFDGVRPNKIIKAGAIEKLFMGSQFCHQSSFVRRSLLKEEQFNTTYNIAADFYFFLQCYLEGRKFFYAGIPIASVESGGVSDIEQGRVVVEWRSIVRSLAPEKLGLNLEIKFQWRILRGRVTSFIKRSMQNMRFS